MSSKQLWYGRELGEDWKQTWLLGVHCAGKIPKVVAVIHTGESGKMNSSTSGNMNGEKPKVHAIS